MSASIAQRWTFTQPSPIGDVTSTYELTPEGLRFRTDAPLGDGTDLLRWDSIAEAATAAADLPAHKGGPDMASWIPGRLEWLLVSHAAAGKRAFMRPLPAGDARNAIVAALRVQLGPRWVGEGLALPAAQKRFPIAARGETLKVAGLVLAVMCVLCAMIVLFTLAASVLYLPVGFLLGGWFFRRGLIGARDALQMANTPTAKVLSAALGRVELEGRAVTDQPPSSRSS